MFKLPIYDAELYFDLVDNNLVVKGWANWMEGKTKFVEVNGEKYSKYWMQEVKIDYTGELIKWPYQINILGNDYLIHIDQDLVERCFCTYQGITGKLTYLLFHSGFLPSIGVVEYNYGRNKFEWEPKHIKGHRVYFTLLSTPNVSSEYCVYLHRFLKSDFTIIKEDMSKELGVGWRKWDTFKKSEYAINFINSKINNHVKNNRSKRNQHQGR